MPHLSPINWILILFSTWLLILISFMMVLTKFPNMIIKSNNMTKIQTTSFPWL